MNLFFALTLCLMTLHSASPYRKGRCRVSDGGDKDKEFYIDNEVKPNAEFYHKQSSSSTFCLLSIVYHIYISGMMWATNRF